ncbi:quinone-dependent dihydroorotate dehydrogenase [Candidatus Saccharibacteria bacterium]|nr:quinone-dependent dihydroorotate dehydrogenase [Candidatus Saccharibacteria bacterium]
MIRRLMWAICQFLYKVTKPLIFIFPPDTTHNAMLKFSIFVGRVTLIRRFVALIFKRKASPRLVQNIHGVKFTNPVGLAAGFDKNGEIMPTIAALGFGFGEVGSVTAEPCDGNPKPWFYRLPKTKSAVVNAGLSNCGSSTVINNINNYVPGSVNNFPIVLSVAKTNSCDVVSVDAGIADYVATIKRAKGLKSVQMIELHISCPNTHGGEPFTDSAKLEKLMKAVDQVGTNKPIFIKMPVDLPWSKFKSLLDIIVRHGVAGVTISNLTKDRTKVTIKDDIPDNVKGSFSGKPVWDLSNDLIKKTYQYYGDKLVIIGVGGVFSAQDAYTKIKLGASMVELITGIIFNGPQLAAQINDGLVRMLKRDGYSHVSDAVGVDSGNN